MTSLRCTCPQFSLTHHPAPCDVNVFHHMSHHHDGNEGDSTMPPLPYWASSLFCCFFWGSSQLWERSWCDNSVLFLELIKLTCGIRAQVSPVLKTLKSQGPTGELDQEQNVATCICLWLGTVKMLHFLPSGLVRMLSHPPQSPLQGRGGHADLLISVNG